MIVSTKWSDSEYIEWKGENKELSENQEKTQWSRQNEERIAIQEKRRLFSCKNRIQFILFLSCILCIPVQKSTLILWIDTRDKEPAEQRNRDWKETKMSQQNSANPFLRATPSQVFHSIPLMRSFWPIVPQSSWEQRSYYPLAAQESICDSFSASTGQNPIQSHSWSISYAKPNGV